MMRREDAEKILATERYVHWQQQALEASGNLFCSLRRTAYALLQHDENGRPFQTSDPDGWNKQNLALQQAHADLGAMSTVERLAVFGAIVPGIAPAVAAGWDLLATMPYQTGGMRRAFRLRHTTGTTPVQAAWINQIISAAREYPEKDVAWFAAWAPYLGHGYTAHQFGILCAAAIDAGGPQGEAVFQVLTASAHGEHEVGAMGRHVTTGLLAAARPDGWEVVERLLLAAQREEGLRQVILEAVDEAHPAAFRRMLRLILDHDLVRFSAVVRAADVWFGLDWNVDHARVVAENLALALRFLDDPSARHEALSGPAPAPYLALWAAAFADAEAAIGDASALLADAEPERRILAAYFVGRLGLAAGENALLPLLDDPDLRVALCAYGWAIQSKTYTYYGHAAEVSALPPDTFERLERLLGRLDGVMIPTPETTTWPWERIPAHAESVAHGLLALLGDRSPKRLLPYIRLMADYDQVGSAKKLAELPLSDREVHDAIFGLATHRSSWVRGRMLEIIGCRPLAPADAPALEAMLTRKSAELRRSALTLLLKQDDAAALASAERLLATRHPLQRLAGLDILGEMTAARRDVAACHARADAYRATRLASGALSPDEEVRLSTVFDAVSDSAAAPTRDNVLGLITPGERTPVVQPQARPVTINTPAARACLSALDALIEAHRTTPVTVATWQGTTEILLGDIGWQFPNPSPTPGVTPQDDARNTLPLAEMWHEWTAGHSADERDSDGLELVRALVMMHGTRAETRPDLTPMLEEVLAGHGDEESEIAALLSVEPADSEAGDADWAGMGLTMATAATSKATGSHTVLPLRRHTTVLRVLSWLVYLQDALPASALDVLLDGVENAFASVPSAVIEQERSAHEGLPHNWRLGQWRDTIARDGAMALLQSLRQWRPELWGAAHHARYWSLLHWLDQPRPGLPRRLPDLETALAAWDAGAAAEADILDHLAASCANGYGYWSHRNDLSLVTARAPHPLIARYPALQRLVSTLRGRILQVELARGELPTAATPLALSLRHSGGTALFVCLVAALEPTDLARGYAYDSTGRATVFSHLLRMTFPDPADTPEEFTRLVRAARIPDKRLVAAAVYAPQWGRHIEQSLDWPHLEDAIWWTHAHTKDANWHIDQALKEAWQAQMSERTPLNAEDLLDGAVDVDWFGRTYRGLGSDRWEVVYDAAKYASGGTGHARARLFADAMTGKAPAADLIRRITDKRNQDAVRALGLLPLPRGARRAAEVAARYNAMQEFLRGSKKFGAQRRASEATAVRIGLENLARTAGYPDPIRLQWAMEAHLAADLTTGSTTVAAGDVQITLALDPLTAEPDITVTTNRGRVLKALPARLKKDPAAVALLERKREIARQVARMRVALEAAMCRGDGFTPREIVEMLGHPVLARLLRNLVFVQEQEGQATILGYPARDGAESGLQFHGVGGTPVTVTETGPGLRLAHPYDLYASGSWHDWQHDCFASERIQPFKQVFRELYVLMANERRNGDDAVSERYAGHQVQPKQALALFGGRGWVTHDEDGARRTFHAEGLSATVTFDAGYGTPAEVEGLTIAGVRFTRRGEWTPIPLTDVPPRVFGEVMRDLDLVVSVAHRGGVDPEATASTVEMRAALVRETCTLLGIDNVEMAGAHAVVRGGLGDYSIHLGSAVVHRQPGGALCIVPVHSQHRGRLFLPFSDNDPRTAEVVSKVILLARDREIKDPSILEQILA